MPNTGAVPCAHPDWRNLGWGLTNDPGRYMLECRACGERQVIDTTALQADFDHVFDPTERRGSVSVLRRRPPR